MIFGYHFATIAINLRFSSMSLRLHGNRNEFLGYFSVQTCVRFVNVLFSDGTVANFSRSLWNRILFMRCFSGTGWPILMFLSSSRQSNKQINSYYKIPTRNFNNLFHNWKMKRTFLNIPYWQSWYKFIPEEI